MNVLSELTAQEHEQLAYIVDRVPEWPEGVNGLWLGVSGWIYDSADEIVVAQRNLMPFDQNSPTFTRAQYEAKKAELAVCPVCSECGGNGAGGAHEDDCGLQPNYRELARELAEAGKLAIEYWEHRMQRYKNRHPVWVVEMRAALTKFRDMEVGSNG